MNSSKISNDPSKEPMDQQLADAQADALLQQRQKQSTSGLSWDEVATEDKKGWHQITEMGEGD